MDSYWVARKDAVREELKNKFESYQAKDTIEISLQIEPGSSITGIGGGRYEGSTESNGRSRASVQVMRGNFSPHEAIAAPLTDAQKQSQAASNANASSAHSTTAGSRRLRGVDLESLEGFTGEKYRALGRKLLDSPTAPAGAETAENITADNLPCIPDAAIHYRCGDNVVTHYGFLPFRVSGAMIELDRSEPLCYLCNISILTILPLRWVPN